MRKKTVVWLAALVVAGTMASPAGAQVAVGVSANYGTESDFGVGARLMIPFSRVRVGVASQVQLGGDLFFPGTVEGAADASWVDLNGNVVFPLRFSEGFRPYLGVGLNLAVRSSDDTLADDPGTKAGINVVGGWRGSRGAAAPFAEVRGVIGGAEQLVLTFGFAFGGGR